MIEKADSDGRFKVDLKELTDILEGNFDKARQIIQSFIHETPEHFENLRETIDKDAKKEIKALLHKLKARYGYFGADEAMREMSAWEDQVDVFDKKKNESLLAHFEHINELLINQLKSTDFYTGDRHAMKKSPLAGKKVLIAEDDEVNAMVFELFVNELGGEVYKAGDGHEAVRLTIEKSPDLIFMDVHMPFYSGLDAIRELRSRGVKCPIVSLSASTRLNEKQDSLESGANFFLVKPANRESINNVLLKYLQ